MTPLHFNDDPRLSWASRGLLALLLTKPAINSPAGMERGMAATRLTAEAIQTAFRALVKFGYVHRFATDTGQHYVSSTTPLSPAKAKLLKKEAADVR